MKTKFPKNKQIFHILNIYHTHLYTKTLLAQQVSKKLYTNNWNDIYKVNVTNYSLYTDDNVIVHLYKSILIKIAPTFFKLARKIFGFIQSLII